MKYAENGKPDFHTTTMEQLVNFEEMLQSLIFTYKRFDLRITEDLKTVWKDVTVEIDRRRKEIAFQVIDTQESKSVEESLSVKATAKPVQKKPSALLPLKNKGMKKKI